MPRELGVSPDALKIIVVEVRSIHQLHAVLSVRAEKDRWLLLDNRTLMLIESSMALDYYDPLYELDQNGVRHFASSPPLSPTGWFRIKEPEPAMKDIQKIRFRGNREQICRLMRHICTKWKMQRSEI